jgi:hypothetical protein
MSEWDDYKATRPFSAALLPGLRSLWGAIEFMSVIPHILFRVYVPHWLGYTVVAERYVVDSVVTIACVMGDPSYITGLFGRILLRLIPEDSVVVYLKCDYQTILGRRGRHTEGRKFILFQNKWYDTLARCFGTSIINTSINSISETYEKLMDILKDSRRERHKFGLYVVE